MQKMKTLLPPVIADLPWARILVIVGSFVVIFGYGFRIFATLTGRPRRQERKMSARSIARQEAKKEVLEAIFDKKTKHVIESALMEELEKTPKFKKKSKINHQEEIEENAENAENEEKEENVVSSDSSDEIVTPSVEIAASQEEPAELSNIEKENISNIASGFRTVVANKGKAADAKEIGNSFFKAGDLTKALDFYSAAVRFCPPDNKDELAVIFANRAAAHLKLENYQATISDCDCALELNENYEKAYMRRYRANRELKTFGEALKNLEKVLEINPSTKDGWAAEIEFLKKKRDIELEETKAEVMGKLKNFGNWALGKVGMSLDDFEVEQNESGQMKISVKPKSPSNEGQRPGTITVPLDDPVRDNTFNRSGDADSSSQSSEGSGNHPASSADERSDAPGGSGFGVLDADKFQPKNKTAEKHLDLSQIRVPDASDFLQSEE